MTNQMDKYLTRTKESTTEQAMSGTATEATTGRATATTDRPSLVYRSPLQTDMTDTERQQSRSGDSSQRVIDTTDQTPGGRESRSTGDHTETQSVISERTARLTEETGARKGAQPPRGSRQSDSSRDDGPATRRQSRTRHTERPADELDSRSGSGGPPTGGSARRAPQDRPLGQGPEHVSQSPSGTRAKRHQHGADSSRGRQTDPDIPVPEESLEYEADVDRVVERLYRKLERRKRIERERKGQR